MASTGVQAPAAAALHDWTQLEKQFGNIHGDSAVTNLRNSVNNDRVVITIGGDQCTGKSTLGKRLAESLNGQYVSAGSVFRAEAAARGITVAQLSATAIKNPEIDVGIDYRMAQLVAVGIDESDPKAAGMTGPLVLEGRQPGIMASYMKEKGGKTSVLRLYISCTVREQALRYIEREMGGTGAAAKAATFIPDKIYESLVDLSQSLSDDQVKLVVEAGNPAEAKESASAEDAIKRAHAWSSFIDNARRDILDQNRYSELYGFKHTYQHASWYDHVIDNSKFQAKDTFAAANEKVQSVLQQKK